MNLPSAVLLLLTDGPGGSGGIARYNMDLIEALAAAEPAPRLQVVCRNGESGAAVPAAVVSVQRQSSRLAFVVAACRAALRLPADGWIFCGHLHFAPLAAWLSRLTGRRWWLQLHGIDAWQRPSPSRAKAVAQAHLVTSVSRYTRQRVLQWSSLDPHRLLVLPNTVGAGFCVGPRPPDHAVGQRERVLLTVGRLAAAEAYKGHDRVISVLAQLNREVGPVRYRIAGTGDDEPRLRALAQQLGVLPQVEFLGAVAALDLPALYRSADLFVMPSTGEGFGIAFLEAMACGTPALGLGVDGSCDPLADGELGALAKESQLAEHIAGVLNAAPRRGMALAEAVRNRFGQPHFAHHVQQLLARLGAQEWV